METITIKRPSSTTDEYGNPVPGPLAPVGTVEMLVAPQMKDEPKLLGRTAIETNYNLYNRVAVSGILPTDTVTVRGEDTPVDGRIATWYETDGTFKGEQIQVRLVNG